MVRLYAVCTWLQDSYGFAVGLVLRLLGSCVDTLYTFRDNITHYKIESAHFWGGF